MKPRKVKLERCPKCNILLPQNYRHHKHECQKPDDIAQLERTHTEMAFIRHRLYPDSKETSN